MVSIKGSTRLNKMNEGFSCIMCFNLDTPSLMNGMNATDENELTNRQKKTVVMSEGFFGMVIFVMENSERLKS